MNMPHARSRVTFYFSAATQFTNAGDALINRELVRLMRSLGRVCAIRGHAPDSFLAEVGLGCDDLISGGPLQLIFSAISDRLRGGTVFLVQTPGDMVGGKVTAGAVVRTVAITLLALMGIKILQVGASLGKLTNAELRLFAWRTRFMQGIGLRDPKSMEMARKAGFRKLFYFPDLAFGTAPRPGKDGGGGAPRVCLSFRSDHMAPSVQEALMHRIKSELASLPVSPQLTIVVQVRKDAEFAKRLMAEFSEWRPELLETLSLGRLSEFYSDVDIVLSNRLHALLLGGLNGALPVAVVEQENNAKVIGLLQGLGLNELVVCSPSALDLKRVWGDFERLRGLFFEVAVKQHRCLEQAFLSAVLR